MTDSLCEDNLNSYLEKIVGNVYLTMIGSSTHPAEPAGIAFDSPLTGAVYYAGAWKGALVLECCERQAIGWAERLMSLTPPVAPEDARDGLGELTNMIAGNLKPMLPPGVSLSMPSVVEGAGHKLRILGAHETETFAFADESGPFRIALVRFLENAA